MIERLKTGNAPHRLFCARIDWCSYATAQGDPRIGVVLDGRVERYTARDFTTEADIAHGRPQWKAAVARNRIDAMLVGRRDALGSLLLLDGRWRVAAADERAVLFLRKKP